MKRKHKQILIIWVGLLAGLLIFRGGWMTYACLLYTSDAADEL